MDTMKVNPHHFTDLGGLKIGGIDVEGDYIYVTGETGELTALIGNATTIYHAVFRAPVGMELISFRVRSEAKETTANATLDVLKAASGTAITSGTAMVTQIDPDTLVDATDKALVVKTDGSEDLAAGNLVVLKVVSGASTSQLKHLAYMAKLKRTA